MAITDQVEIESNLADFQTYASVFAVEHSELLTEEDQTFFYRWRKHYGLDAQPEGFQLKEIDMLKFMADRRHDMPNAPFPSSESLGAVQGLIEEVQGVDREIENLRLKIRSLEIQRDVAMGTPEEIGRIDQILWCQACLTPESAHYAES